MPPILALFLTLAFIFFLFRRESQEDNGVSGALWIPLIWFLTGIAVRFPMAKSPWISCGWRFTQVERLPSTPVGQQLPGATFRFQIPNGLANNRRQPTPETRVVNHRHEQR
jgi:hypothetical protein